MSGGLDSSMAAHLLQQQGYDVFGLFMRLGLENERTGEQAEKVCKFLGMPFYRLDLQEKFKRQIIDYFITGYKKGLTPNPCVKCNQKIKFEELLRYSKKLRADLFATGHYVNVKKTEKGGECTYKLYKAKDRNKDQSYFLYNLTQHHLGHLIFPMADMEKEELRKKADRIGLPYIRSESQDICFLNDVNGIIPHNDFLRMHLEEKWGEIRTMDGKVVGHHKGLYNFTIGQRRGIEIGGTGPYYAAKFDFKKNILYAVKDFNDPLLYKDSLTALNVNWISGHEPKLPLACHAVIRYRHDSEKCSVGRVEGAKDRYLVKFKTPQRAITPGQSVVFYKGNEVLGGGVIK